MQLTQLIYVSDLMAHDESLLVPILEASVRRNLELGITGMLLYSAGNFIQVLEGDEKSVLDTYERICQDRRHRHVTQLYVGEVRERHFSRWSMGYKQLREEDVLKFPQYAPYFKYGFGAKSFDVLPGDALDMLMLFSKSVP